MKTITKTINLYELSELTDKAKEKALADWNEGNDFPIMQSHMINLLKERLDERGIQYDADSIDVRYSLSYSQGDGFMFLGKVQWEGYYIVIKHSGHYFHSNSKDIDIYEDANQNDHADEKVGEEFEKVYQEICDQMERIGYDEIEYQQSMELFTETCEDNEYMFTADGTMETANTSEGIINK